MENNGSHQKAVLRRNILKFNLQNAKFFSHVLNFRHVEIHYVLIHVL